jgi:hypothetical protein
MLKNFRIMTIIALTVTGLTIPTTANADTFTEVSTNVSNGASSVGVFG